MMAVERLLPMPGINPTIRQHLSTLVRDIRGQQLGRCWKQPSDLKGWPAQAGRLVQAGPGPRPLYVSLVGQPASHRAPPNGSRNSDRHPTTWWPGSEW